MGGRKLPYEDYHKHVDNKEYKKCPDCLEWLEMNSDNFYKNKAVQDGYNTWCKKCTIERSKNNQNKNRDEYLIYQREYSKEYMKNPKRREYHREIIRNRNKNGKNVKWQRDNKDKLKVYSEKHRNHEISKQEWIDCKEYFNNSCAYCGLNENDHYMTYLGKPRKSDLHKEHVIHDGENDLSNCVPACRICNSSKWQQRLDEWYNSVNPNYSEERLNKINTWLKNDYLKFKENANMLK